jgi:hypothetical protein
MLVQYRSRCFALKSGLLVLAVLVFLGGLGTRLSKYRSNQDRATTIAKVRLGVEKQPDLSPIHFSQLQPTAQEDLSFSVSRNCWEQETRAVAGPPEATERIVPVHPSYDLNLPQLAYRPPPTLS